MAMQFTGLYNASNTDNALLKIKDTMVAAGWTLHDTIASPLQYVLYSDGETPAARHRVYVHLDGRTNNYIYIEAYWNWNNTTHTGYFTINRATFCRVKTLDASTFDMFCVADLDSVLVCTYITSTWHFGIVARYEPFYDPCYGTTDASISAGSGQDLSLGAGEAAGFRVGQEVYIISDNGREAVTVAAVNTSTDTVTVDDVAYAHASGANVGSHPMPWYTMSNVDGSTIYAYGYRMSFQTTYTGQDTTSYVLTSIFANAAVDPDRRTNLYTAFPLLVCDADSVLGFSPSSLPWLRCIGPSSSLHTMSIGDLDTGTSTGTNTSTTLNDTGKTWTTNAYQNKILIITAGVGVGQYRKITSNTATEITVPTWTTTPDATSEYTIADECWLYLYFGNSANSSGIIRAA